jgi:hypothetical protein
MSYGFGYCVKCAYREGNDCRLLPGGQMADRVCPLFGDSTPYVDLMNAVENQRDENFTCGLFRLMLKADSSNLARLGAGFPFHAEMVRVYRTRCPYVSKDGVREVDWAKIETMAREALAAMSRGAGSE